MNTPSKEFSESARRYTADLHHRDFIQKGLAGYYVKRDEFKNRFQSWQGARDIAAETKWEAINHLDRYLEEFTSKLEARGVKVFWARDGQEARDYIVRVARENKVRSIIKSKSMTTEEIHLNEALEKEGFGVVESDLGEYIVQLRNEPPYHFVFPSMHLTRGQISDLFHDKLGSEPTNNPEDLTMIARRVMRKKFCEADMGITGGNFAVAEMGAISITENEGNSRLTASLPKIHISVIGIEKVLPKLSDLALFLPMLATAGAGQGLTCYNTLYSAARLPGEPDGPQQFHVVLLDNRRTQLLADAEQRDALHCIRCGACLNVCPIFKNVGGHSYGTEYQGPIGSVITPHLRGLHNWKHLSQASSLCGACTEACPVKINLHHHLLHNRRNAAQSEPSLFEKILYGGFAFTMQRPKFYQLTVEISRILQPLRSLVEGTILDPLRPWTKTRSFPQIPQKSFRDLWRERAIAPEAPQGDVEVPVVHTEHSHEVSSALPDDGRSQGREQNGREVVLGRIREALKIAAPHPVSDAAKPLASPQKWLPLVGQTLGEQIELFRQNSENLKTEFRVCADLNEASQFVQTLVASNGLKKLAFHKGELTNTIAGTLNLPKVATDGGYALDELESCDVGLTECEALIAQTGSVLISARNSGGRALSVLPPHHIVIARRNQVVPDLTVALQKAREKFGDKFPSILSFITGPSRTGDIERILVLGAHGPKRLTVLLV